MNARVLKALLGWFFDNNREGEGKDSVKKCMGAPYTVFARHMTSGMARIILLKHV